MGARNENAGSKVGEQMASIAGNGVQVEDGKIRIMSLNCILYGIVSIDVLGFSGWNLCLPSAVIFSATQENGCL